MNVKHDWTTAKRGRTQDDGHGRMFSTATIETADGIRLCAVYAETLEEACALADMFAAQGRRFALRLSGDEELILQRLIDGMVQSEAEASVRLDKEGPIRTWSEHDAYDGLTPADAEGGAR